MHLTFPDRSDRFTQEELGCLAAALGFRNDILRKCVPVTNKRSAYIETKVLQNLIDRKIFNHDLHEAHNMRDGVYNVKVLEKSVSALSKRLITFSELKTIRIAFDVYECQDLSGMEICPHIILRTLKMCGRVISPKKLMDCIKHMPRDIPDRLTLYEFLELVPMCERISDVKTKLQEQADVKRRRRSIRESELADFHDILVQEEKKQTDFLDEDYEQSFFRPAFEDKPTWRIPPEDVINNEEWMKHVLTYQELASDLDVCIENTNRQVVRARTSTPGAHTRFRNVNLSASDFNHSRSAEKITETVRACSELGEISGLNKGTLKTPASKSPDSVRRLSKPRQYCWSEEPKESPTISRRSKLRKNEFLVSKEALQETDTKVINLLWDLEMKDTLLKIRSGKQGEPKARKKVREQESCKDQINSEETSPLKEVDEKSSAKCEKRTSTVSSTAIARSPTELYTLLSARCKKRDQLLSRSNSFPRDFRDSFANESSGRYA